MALEEVQDNNGATNDGTVDATRRSTTLIAAIQTAGGPTYQFRQIDPVEQPGWRRAGRQYSRQGFLFRTDRGLSFVDRPGGSVDEPPRRCWAAARPAAHVQPWPHRSNQRRI